MLILPLILFCHDTTLSFFSFFRSLLTFDHQKCSTIAQPYTFVKELGQGAYGCVISARHEDSGEMCAVKKVSDCNRQSPRPNHLTTFSLSEIERKERGERERELIMRYSVRDDLQIDHECLFEKDPRETLFEGNQASSSFPRTQECESVGFNVSCFHFCNSRSRMFR